MTNREISCIYYNDQNQCTVECNTKNTIEFPTIPTGKTEKKKNEEDRESENNENGIASINEHDNMEGVLKVVMLGQVIAIANACTGAASTTLAEACRINSPAVQSGCMYFILSSFIFLLPRTKIQQRSLSSEKENSNDQNEHAQNQSYYLPFTKIQLQAPWYYYAMLAFMDLQANYVTYFAYRYTSFTSIALLDSLSIPSVMVFSRWLLKRRYHVWHYFGILVCLIGFIITLNSDMNKSDDPHKTNDSESSRNRYLMDHSKENLEQDFPHAFFGDIMAIIGAILYGLNDTLTELSVKKFSSTEFLGMLGVFGIIFSSIEIILLEPNALSSIFPSTTLPTCSSFMPIILLAWNAISLALFYIGASYFLLQHDAALLDLSLLTTNLYAILFVICREKQIPPHPMLYLLSVGMVILGVFVYEKGSSISLLKMNTMDEPDDAGCEANTNTLLEAQTLLIEKESYNSTDCEL